jgi:hypothetical protein
MTFFALFSLLVHRPVSIRVCTGAVALVASKSLDLSLCDVALLKNPCTPLPLPHFHHHAHSALPPFFKTQFHALKLLPPPVIPYLHHRIEASCFALDETFLPFWPSFALGSFRAHIRSSFACLEGIYCTGKYFHLSPPNAPSTLWLHPLEILSNNTCT